MTPTVLIIDPSPAVQAITALALSQTNCTVEALADGQEAVGFVRSLKPAVILCAKDISNLDPYEFASTVRVEFPRTAFVLLASTTDDSGIASIALNSGYSQVVYKPFKSNKLREIVEKLLFENATIEIEKPHVLLDIQNLILRKMWERILHKREIDHFLFSTEYRTKSPECRLLTIAEWDHQRNLNWYESETATNVLLLVPESELEIAEALFPESKILTRPLTYQKLSTQLNLFLKAPEINESIDPDPTEGATDGTPMLAAKICASIFEKLLLDPALSSRDWKRASSIAQKELIRITSS